MIGYKVMRYENGYLIAGANNRLKIKAQVGNEITFPGNGIYLGTDKKYVMNYYSGLADKEALLTLEFDPKNIVTGTLTDKEVEISVNKCKIVDIEILESVMESQEPIKDKWGNNVYYQDLRNETFIHFTTGVRAFKIKRSGKLLMDPPYKKFGTDTVDAVSLTHGKYVPGVQTAHRKLDTDRLLAVVFKTDTMPKNGIGCPEEVKWDQDVILKNVKVVRANEAIKSLENNNSPDDEDYIITYIKDNPSLFESFIKSLKRPGNETLIEAVLKGYAVIFESNSGINDSVDDLLADARKYKTADEFVRAHGVVVHHGGDKPIRTAEDINLDNNVFYTLKRTDKVLDELKATLIPTNYYSFDELARMPAKAFGKEVSDFVVNFKNPKIINANGKEWMEIYDGTMSDWTNRIIRDAIKSGKNYDGIIIKNIEEGFSGAGVLGASAGLVDDYIVLDRITIKPISYFADIWNKAHNPQSGDGLGQSAHGIDEAAVGKFSSTTTKGGVAPKGYIDLYRGMTREFDSNFDLSKTDAVYGYSTWTDSAELAKQYAGNNGHIYRIRLPIAQLGKELIDENGDRVLFVDNEKKAGLNNISGKEYLVYTHHDEYSPSLISKFSPTTAKGGGMGALNQIAHGINEAAGTGYNAIFESSMPPEDLESGEKAWAYVEKKKYTKKDK